MEALEQLYRSFLDYFPSFLQPIVSLGLAVLLVYSIFQSLRRNFIFLIVLVVMLPASLPILKDVLEVLIKVVKYLLGMGE